MKKKLKNSTKLAALCSQSKSALNYSVSKEFSNLAIHMITILNYYMVSESIQRNFLDRIVVPFRSSNFNPDLGYTNLPVTYIHFSNKRVLD